MDPIGLLVLILAATSAATIAGIGGGGIAISRARFLKRTHAGPFGLRIKDSPWSKEHLDVVVEDFARYMSANGVWSRKDNARALTGLLVCLKTEGGFWVDEWGRRVAGTFAGNRTINVAWKMGDTIGDTALGWELCRLALANLGRNGARDVLLPENAALVEKRWSGHWRQHGERA